jgi:hypothetical protein
MAAHKSNKEAEKSVVDEEYLMDLMSGDKPLPELRSGQVPDKENGVKDVKSDRSKARALKKVEYEDFFLINRFPSGRNGKVVYIRSEFHERLLRIVQLTREDKVTLYSYLDNILEHHFREFGDDITEYFNSKFKPIL